MASWMKAKLTIIILAAVAVFTVAGAGAVMAAQSHSGFSPFTHTSDGSVASNQQQQNGFEAQGAIQQVTFDQNTTQSGNLVFLPSGQQTTVTVVFTTATKIEVSGDSSSSSSNDGQGNNNAGTQPNTLQAGMNAKVEGTAQADGSVLAKEIDANAKNGDDNDGQGDQTLVGVVQSVDKNAQTFVLLPDGQTTPVTIAFDAKTNVDDEHNDGGNNVGLAAGAHVSVEVITRSDGSLYAKEIKSASGNDGSGDNGGDGDGHNGQPTPTPGSGGHAGGGSGGGN